MASPRLKPKRGGARMADRRGRVEQRSRARHSRERVARGARRLRVTVIGLGKVGAPLAATLAARGFDVVGVDKNRDFVEAIHQGRAPIVEPRLQEMMDLAGGRIRATTDCVAAVASSELSFVVVPTPSDATGRFSLRYVLEAARDIGRGLSEHPGRPVVVLVSTVMPGDTDAQLRPALEAASGKRCGAGFGLCYSPEFIALGNVVTDILRPDFVLIGSSDDHSAAALARIYARLCETDPPICRMNLVNAELTKLAVNSYVTMRISFANALAQICEGLPGADVERVTATMSLDSRIGSKYLRGALSFGGPCFPRDNRALGVVAHRADVAPVLAEATDEVNRVHLDRLLQLVLRRCPNGGTVAVLGLAYKANTPVVEASPGTDLVAKLRAAGIPVTVYDPLAMAAARAMFGEGVAYAKTAREAVGSADVVVLTTPCDEFRSLRPDDLRPGRPMVIDCWRILPAEAFAPASNYVVIGRGPDAKVVIQAQRDVGAESVQERGPSHRAS